VKKMDARSAATSRTITGAEVVGWFAPCRPPKPDAALCAEVARRLTQMRWPGDVPSPPLPELDDDSNPYWDFQAATDAAKTLRDSVPAMLQHWEGLKWAPKTREGHAAIKALGEALELALPWVEWPFGKYERKSPLKRPRPKDWHTPALMIAHIIAEALITTGRRKPGLLAANSTTVCAVRKALMRMGYPDIDQRTIAAHFARLAARGYLAAGRDK
jgi:hypothetical protein